MIDTSQSSAAIDIIDLDIEDSFLPFDPAKNKEVQIAFTVAYIKGRISNSDLIAMKVFLGLLPAIASPKYSTDLSLEIAARRIEKDGISGMVGATMIMSEIGRIFTLEEQMVILNKLKGKV
jgi:hypothetical protein